jgi:hypothetical protein
MSVITALSGQEQGEADPLQVQESRPPAEQWQAVPAADWEYIYDREGLSDDPDSALTCVWVYKSSSSVLGGTLANTALVSRM